MTLTVVRAGCQQRHWSCYLYYGNALMSESEGGFHYNRHPDQRDGWEAYKIMESD